MNQSKTAFDDTTTLAHYQIKTCIGEGGYGAVYEAWDSKLCRSVAIKRIKQAPSGQAGASLLREARLAASLHHAAFVKIHAVEQDGDSQSIVMELVPGSTVKALIESNRIAPSEALDWVGQVADAMQVAHASGLVHGDLKPSNLMVEPCGALRILDFGLATKHDPLATTSLAQIGTQGTIAYMAPERLHGAPPDARSDVYALGIMLYELLCGARPFAVLNGLALAAAHAQSSSDQWDYSPSLSPALVKLIRAMTAHAPAQRLAGMAQVSARLAALSPRRARSRAPAGVPPALPWRPAAKTGRIAGALLAAALLSVGAWQALPYLPALQLAATPYSETLEMRRGLASLKLYEQPGRLERARQAFDTMLAHTPGNAAAAAGLSLMYSLRYVNDGQDEVWLQKADAGAQQALMLDAQLALSHVAKGWVLDTQGKYAPAQLAFDQALRLDPLNFFAWHGKSLALRHLRRHAEARAHTLLAAQRFPSEPVFSNELGTIDYEQGDYRAAERHFRRSIEIEPDAVLAYVNLNAALLQQNRGDEALQVLQQGLQVRPSANLYCNLGNALFMRGDYVAAATAFENAVSPTKGAPGDYINWANLADTLLWIPGRAEQARKAYEKARQLLAPRLERAPNDATLVSRMALYAARTKSKPDAEALIRRAQTLAPANPVVWFRAALAHELLGNRASALAAIGKSRQLGYSEKFIEAEPDLVALRRDPAYAARD
ncbi:MAG: protein kinase [Pseudomonadota bacterium]